MPPKAKPITVLANEGKFSPCLVLAEPQTIPHERQARESTNDRSQGFETRGNSRGGGKILTILLWTFKKIAMTAGKINIHAQALGRLNKGRKKTMTPAAIRQRRAAGKVPKRKKKKNLLDGIDAAGVDLK